MKHLSSQQVLKTSLIVDLSDLIFNIIIALLTGSMVMLAEALQGFADLTTSGLLLIGLRRARRRADQQHRFGYGRELYFWSLMAGLFMFAVTASLSFYSGWQRFLHPQPISNPVIALLTLAFAVLTNGYALSLSYQRLRADSDQPFWQILNNSVLIEIKAAFALDLMGTASALLGFAALLLYQATDYSQFDGLGAMIIGLSIAALATFLIIDIKDLLIGRGASADITDKIEKSALEVPGVTGVRDLRSMYVGSERLLVTMALDIEPRLKSRNLGKLLDKIKTAVKHKTPAIHHLHIELETEDS